MNLPINQKTKQYIMQQLMACFRAGCNFYGLVSVK